jgi:hypothetical protein
MNLRAKAAAYGIGGLGLAGIMIFSGIEFGVITPASTGVVSVLLTDPPTVPTGVTAVYVTYSNLALHASGLGDSGWVSTGGQGTLETLGLVNLAKTISTGSVPALKYDIFAFTISAATVQFNGKNYSASVNSGRLVVPIAGGLEVNASHPSATLIDIQPIVLNLGDQSHPRFVISTGVKALQVPNGEVNEQTQQVGSQLALSQRGWYQSFESEHKDALAPNGASLSPNSFSLKVKNNGSDEVNIKIVIISPTSSSGGGQKSQEGVPASLANSIVFVVQPDGSLQLLKASSGGEEHPDFESEGYHLAVGASFTFSYSGAMTSLASKGITTGTTYNIILVDEHPLSIQTVTAA